MGQWLVLVCFSYSQGLLSFVRLSECGTFTSRKHSHKEQTAAVLWLTFFSSICPGANNTPLQGFHLAAPTWQLPVVSPPRFSVPSSQFSGPDCPLSGCCLSRRIQTEVQTRVAAFTGSFAFGFCLAHLSALKGYSNYSSKLAKIGSHKTLYLSSNGFNWLLGFLLFMRAVPAKGIQKWFWSTSRFPRWFPAFLCFVQRFVSLLSLDLSMSNSFWFLIQLIEV